MSEGPILVTGATGNVGRPVVEALLAAGKPVRAAVGPATGLAGLGKQASPTPDGIAPLVLDFTDPATWQLPTTVSSGCFCSDRHI